METVNDIRAAFLEFFRSKGHAVMPSSPLVPRNDPTLMFTNSGMVQFKNIFTGNQKRESSRVTTSQKCLRAGGKHNDLENVGHTARHHTFFEMLGNFSFGDYFKEAAIELAWSLVTKEFGLPEDKLLVTVHTSDEIAAELWKKVASIPESRIIKIPTSDNFWSMGDTGPCGPCSEIFFDHGDHISGGPPGSALQDGDRFIEIWNLVFMQYEQVSENHRIDLPKPSIDTGMGLERVAAVMQGTHDNFKIDTMQALTDCAKEQANVKKTDEADISFRVMADHLRAIAFLIAEGVFPSNEGRGYVLRRIMRRAMRHAHIIGCDDPIMWKLVPTLMKQMGQAFPELIMAESLIVETLRLEEERFKKLLDRGLKLLDTAVSSIGKNKVLNGETAFKLYDTYGFPLDLTQDALRSQNIAVDAAGFEATMELARTKARANWRGSGDATMEKVWFEVRKNIEATEFLGYQTEIAEGQLVAIIFDGKQAKTASQGQEVSMVFNQSPFYAEAGGQAGDTGQVKNSNGATFKVLHTRKVFDDLNVNIGRVTSGTFTILDEVSLSIDGLRRKNLRANHSATHLIHAALRNQLGNHVMQKGSLVEANRMRFDISHPEPIALNRILQIESEVNEQIRYNSEVVTRVMDPETAVTGGAMALFGEKYGDQVRVVSMGKREKQVAYSVELCGGTHVRQTGDIGLFKILSESAVGSGIRRLEIVTGEAAEEHVSSVKSALDETASILKVTPVKVVERVKSLIDDRKKLENTVANLRRKIATGEGNGDKINKIDIGGYSFVSKLVEGMPAKELKGLADEMQKHINSGVVALVSNTNGKASLVVSVTKDLTNKVSAVDLVREACPALGGKGGGGRPEMAQAGGPNGGDGQHALNLIETLLKKIQIV